MEESPLESLFNRYVHKKCAPEEEKELMAILAESTNEQDIKRLIDKVAEDEESEMPMPDQVAASILQKILQNGKPELAPDKSCTALLRPWIHIAAAAVLLFIISVSFYWSLTKKDNRQVKTFAVSSKNIPSIVPGGNRAKLLMADGSTIVLDTLQNGKIPDGNATINKQNGLLVYDRSMPSKASTPVFHNTLITPRGGQYQVVLPDGSKVWLNASSSLRFPTAFVGKQRSVELTGEAYFEIRKNSEKPFHVKVTGIQVEVLGTHFNVNAYTDESCIKTTLLEGSVKIKDGSESRLLKPGQQGLLEKNENNLKIKEVNMDEVMAWKNGLFQFDGSGIETIMREISRWYDVDINYSGKVPVRSFEGKISREAQLSDVLEILKLSDVKFNVEGNKIVVH